MKNEYNEILHTMFGQPLRLEPPPKNQIKKCNPPINAKFPNSNPLNGF